MPLRPLRRPARLRAIPAAAAAPGFVAAPTLSGSGPGDTVERIADGLSRPWVIAFLPEGDRLPVTERTGALKLVGLDGGAVAEVAGVPEVVAEGQGGLLDIALHPDYPAERHVYLTGSGADDRGRTATHVGRATLDREAMALGESDVLFAAGPVFPTREGGGPLRIAQRLRRWLHVRGLRRR